MQYKRAFSNIRCALKDKRGITLVEIIVASTVFFVLIGALLGFSLFATKTMAESTTKSDSQAKARQMFTYVSKTVHPAYTINILSVKPASFTSGHQYIYIEDGYLKLYDGAKAIQVSNDPLQNLTVTFTRGVTSQIMTMTINFKGLTNSYTEQVLAENAGTSAGTGTTGACLEIILTP